MSHRVHYQRLTIVIHNALFNKFKHCRLSESTGIERLVPVCEATRAVNRAKVEVDCQGGVVDGQKGVVD